MKRLEIRRADRCRTCDVELPIGAEAWWDADDRAVRCLACVGATGVREVSEVPETAAGPVDAVDGGAAGRSARREYARRAARERARHEQAVADDLAWRKAAVERRPVLGRIATAVTSRPAIEPEKQSTTAWKVGAEGEERVAEVVTGLAGIEVLHDRRVPNSRANIDHLVVGPAGVFVIDAKKYEAGSQVEARDVGGLLRPDRRLYVGGRDRTKLVDGVRRQVDIVRTVLGPDLAALPVRGVLCFVGATWGWRMRPKTVGGVTAIWPKGLPDMVTGRGPHTDAVEHVAAHLRQVLPPAAG